jgi:carboxyl-terminal processing protease
MVADAGETMQPFNMDQMDHLEHGEQPIRTEPPRERSTSGIQGISQVLVTAILVAVAFGAGWFGNMYVNSANIATGDQRQVLQAWNDIDQNFVVTGSIDHKKMAYAAIQAMVDSLGDTGHSRFETPEQLAQEQQQLNNAPTVGIGVYLSGGGQQPIKIDAVIPDSPASKTNLSPGDWIVGVNGQNVRGKTIEQVRPLIGGPEGTNVTLTIIRPSVSTTATFDVPITRGKFSVKTVVSYIIPGLNIAHIQIVQFAQDADSQLRTALKDAQAAHVKGIILDLRDNPGGYLDQSVAVASEFIPAGQGKNVLIERSRTGSQTVPVTAGGLATSTPLVILVNNSTASAAEIVAGSIAVNRPDVHVVGEKTFGTGTVLQQFILADGSALWLGTQEWLLPNGQSIYHSGFTPDQQVALPSTVSPVSPLVAQEEKLTQSQILSSGDTQLLKAIHLLGG